MVGLPPCLEGLSEGGLIDLARARLHHDDGVAGTGGDEIKVTLVGLAVAEKPSSVVRRASADLSVSHGRGGGLAGERSGRVYVCFGTRGRYIRKMSKRYIYTFHEPV